MLEVTSEELKNIRIKMLKEMNEYVVTKVKNPQDVLLWHCFCIPEDPTEEDYLENAMNDEFEDCSTFFMGIVDRSRPARLLKN